jgi:hypothetical protein
LNTFNFTRIPAMGLALIFGVALMFSSCSSSNDVASSHFLQKRKHRPGVHLNWGNKHQVKQHAQVQKEDLKKEQHLVLEADNVLVEKPTQKVPDSLLAERSAESVFTKPKKLPAHMLQVLAKRPALQKMATQKMLTKSTRAKSWLEGDDPIASDEKESSHTLLGNLALIAGILSMICLVLAPALWLFFFTPLALIPFLLSLLSGVFGVIAGSLSKPQDRNGKIGLILSAITLGTYLATLLFIVVLIIVVLINFSR